jgi:hypothetical protein
MEASRLQSEDAYATSGVVVPKQAVAEPAAAQEPQPGAGG